MARIAATTADKPSEHVAHSSEVYERLRRKLVLGEFAPGEKLKPQHLKTQLGCTSGTLREALIRLAGEGLVVFEDQRGFSTIVPTEESFQEIRHLRTLIEAEGARLSILHGDLEWEANLSAAHHRLAHVEERMRAGGDLRGNMALWLAAEWEFHRTLLSACGSELLKAEHKAIFDKFRMHAMTELRAFGFRDQTTIREHSDILESALRRDADACAAAIDRHFRIYRTRDDRNHAAGG